MIKYPILNISLSKWDNNVIQEMFRYDDIYYSQDELFFQSYLLNHDFVDCDGFIYKLIKKNQLKRNGLIRFFTSKHGKLIFEKTTKQMSFYELKELLINRVNQLSGREAVENWIEEIHKSSNIKELINGRATKV